MGLRRHLRVVSLMAENTDISWADDTFNPWEGCQKVSPACDGCYAEARNLRYAPKGSVDAPNWGPDAPRRRTSASNWAKPLKWEREQKELVDRYSAIRVYPDQAASDPPPPRFVFCASLADVFDNAVPPEWRRDLFDLIRATPHLTWLLLTKRSGNIVKLFTDTLDPAYGPNGEEGDWYLPDVWPRNAAIGCTVVTQEEADRDIPKLLAAKAALNPAFAFVSMEPLMERVDMRLWMPQGRLALRPSGEEFYTPHWYMTKCQHCGWVGSSEFCGTDSVGDDSDVYCPACHGSGLGDDYPTLDWVIAGGETDQGKHKARPSHPDWFRSLRDQCAAAGVPYHHKQNGEWAAEGYEGQADGPSVPWGIFPAGGAAFTVEHTCGAHDDGQWMAKAGKRKAGRLLDGVTHDARPEMAR
jgi:protein gp37